MIGRGVDDQTPKAPIRRIGAKVKETKVGTMIIIIVRFIMFEMGITTTTTTSTGVTMVTDLIGVRPIFHLKMVKFLLQMVEVVWHELRILCIK